MSAATVGGVELTCVVTGGPNSDRSNGAKFESKSGSGGKKLGWFALALGLLSMSINNSSADRE